MKFKAKAQSPIKSLTDGLIDTAVPLVVGGVVNSFLSPKLAITAGLLATFAGEHYQNRWLKDGGMGTVLCSGVNQLLSKQSTSTTQGVGDYEINGVDGFADKAKSFFSAFTDIVKPAATVTLPATTATTTTKGLGYPELDYPSNGTAGEPEAPVYGLAEVEVIGSIGTLGNVGEVSRPAVRYAA